MRLLSFDVHILDAENICPVVADGEVKCSTVIEARDFGNFQHRLALQNIEMGRQLLIKRSASISESASLIFLPVKSSI